MMCVAIVLSYLALGETLNAFVEPVHLDQLGTSDLVLRSGRKLRITSCVKVEGDDLRDPITPHIQPLTRAEALEQIQLLFAQLEQLSIELAAERRVREEQERGTRVHNRVRVLAEIVC